MSKLLSGCGAIFHWLMAPFFSSSTPTNTIEARLARCPFCGASQGRLSIIIEHEVTCASAPQLASWHRVQCIDCGASTPGSTFRETAIEQWNRREPNLSADTGWTMTKDYWEVLEAIKEAGFYGQRHFEREIGVEVDALIGRSWQISHDRIFFQE